jgi:hypothetical protein
MKIIDVLNKIANGEEVKGEKVYDIGDIVLYNKKKYKITYTNWKINEYRIEEVEEPHDYHWVSGDEIREKE